MAIRPLMLAWLLLFAATLAMGGVAWWLLGREVTHVESLADATLSSRAAAAADNVDLLMEEIKAGVMDTLLVIRQAPSPNIALADMVANNPYVQAGYVYRTSDSVTNWYGQRNGLPTPLALEQASTGQSQYFPWSEDFEAVPAASYRNGLNEVGVERRVFDLDQAKGKDYAPSDAYDVSPPGAMEAKEAEAQSDDKFAAAKGNLAFKQQRAAVRQFNVEQVNRAEGNTLNVASDEVAEQSLALGAASANNEQATGFAFQESQAAQQTTGQAVFGDSLLDVKRGFTGVQQRLDLSPEPPPRQGWVVADHDKRKHWMAWVDLPSSGNFLGAWLKRDTVIAELQKSLIPMQADGLTIELIDADGNRIQPLGRDSRKSYISRYGSEPDMTLAVGTALPGWRIEVSRTGNTLFGRSFRVLGGVIVVGLCLGILCGGTLLLWQARRDSLEAKRKTTFVANVSHELKTPLTSIRLFAEMLYDGRANDPEKERSYLQTMLNETQRLTRLVNNVLDFSQLERGRRDFHYESHDLVPLIVEWVESQRVRLEGDGLTVELVLPESLTLEVDPDALEQILLNLLDNASKYAASGKRAIVTLEKDDVAWSMSVSDFGPGIPTSERKRVFASFHRVDDRLTADRPGCGLGLSIAARLAKGMGGELSLHVNKPSGCRFTLTVKN